ncbi:MAG: hypothetical protein Q7K39_04130 [Candidatus Magasanikbacteria bacterium]|nr:hypothetical protein [Candidatus Magasanikbacteria bacterium]
MAHQKKRCQSQSLAAKRRMRLVITTKGEHHDLAEIRDAIVRDYADIFGRGFRVKITWGNALPRGRAHIHRNVRLGGYDDERNPIIIHRTLDRAAVPRCYVEWSVFHELLHAKFEVPLYHGRHDFHPRWFRVYESTFARQDQALKWVAYHASTLSRF